MLLFRSEEHVEAWCAKVGLPRGEIITPAQGWGLAAWYADRLDAGYQRKSAGEAEAFFRSLGLVSEFWTLG